MSINRFKTIGSKMFKTVVLGGTFDGIHAGHKILFMESIKMCNHRMVVGVTDANMIKSKVLWELIAPVEERVENVEKFLRALNPALKYHVVPIKDLYGPTIEEKNMDCIVVSKETERGAVKINEARELKGWPKLEVHVIELMPEEDTKLQGSMSRLCEKKVSSSLMRMEKLGTVLREPEMNPNIPDRPYIIGLTGGIASGKTAIGKYLQSLGFGYINYDLLGHKTYEVVGSPIYSLIVNYFGDCILNPETKAINRSELGKIVFSDRSKLDKLNELVWPGIHKLVDEEVEAMKGKHDVIVLESALLIESKQTKRVHQVWTTIIPPEESVKRQVESRGLSSEEAQKRVLAQIDNSTRVKASNVVFCSLWESEFTQQQVKKSVSILREKYLIK